MKQLSSREKTMLVLLIVVVLAIGWFKLVYQPVNEAISGYQASQQNEQADIETNMLQITKIRQMESELEELKADPDVKPTPLYDNSKELMVALNAIMLGTEEFSIDFGNTEQDGFIVYRSISMYFTTSSYSQARQLLDRIDEEIFTNQIQDLSISNDERTGETNVSAEIVFFEVVN